VRTSATEDNLLGSSRYRLLVGTSHLQHF